MIQLELERRKRGLTQDSLGKGIGIDPASICRFEKGRLKPYPGDLKKLSQFFNISAEELFKEV